MSLAPMTSDNRLRHTQSGGRLPHRHARFTRVIDGSVQRGRFQRSSDTRPLPRNAVCFPRALEGRHNLSLRPTVGYAYCPTVGQ